MATALWIWSCATLRRRWRPTLIVVMLFGLGLGLVLTATAGARRTETAYPRMLDATNTSDLLVNPDAGVDSDLDVADVEALPGVVDLGYVAGMFVVPSDEGGRPDFDAQTLTLASADGVLGYGIQRPLLMSGRLPDPDHETEILVDQEFADRNDLVAGDTHIFHVPDFEASDPVQFPPVTEPVEMTVAGVGVGSDQILVDDAYAVEQVLLTPAFYRGHPELTGFFGLAVKVAGGREELLDFRHGVEALVPGESVEFRTQATVTETVDRSATPLVVSLYALAGLVAIATVTLIAQGMARVLAVDPDERHALLATGTTRRELFAALFLRAMFITCAAVVLAVGLALLLSPLFPVGFVRPAEPDPGFRFDATVMAGTAVPVVVVLLVVVAAGTWVALGSVANDDTRTAERTSRIASGIRRRGAGPSLATGVQFAVEPRARRGSGTLASTLLGGVLLVALVSGCLAFGASLHHLVDSPSLYGWNWDVLVGVEVDADGLEATFGPIDGVEASSTVSNSRITVEDRPVPAMALSRLPAAVGPTIIEGHAPEHDGEVAFGARTLETLDAQLGDTVSATSLDGDEVPLEVVGQAAFPGIGTYQGADRAELGRGAIVTPNDLERLGPSFGITGVVLDLDEGTTPAQVAAPLRGTLGDALEGDDLLLLEPQRPSDIVALDRVRNIPITAVLLLALLILVASTFAILSSSRSRRRDLAILETIGFQRGQIALTVMWEGLTVVAIAFLIGVPVGTAVGRHAWIVLAHDLGAVADPITPWAGIAVFVVLGLAGNALLALLAGSTLARRRPAHALRSE